MVRLVAALLVACRGAEPSLADGGAASAASSTPPSASSPATSASAGAHDFAGTYDSTEGRATITQKGFDVTIRYKTGHADCDAAGPTLTCTWHEGTDYGAARLSRVAGGKLVGTWGVGKSSTSGGEWVFVPTR